MAVGSRLIITAASYNAERASVGSAGVRSSGELVWTVEVLTPFGYISRHVVQPEFIRMLAGYRVRPLPRYSIEPPHTIRLVSSRKTVMFGLFSSAGCELPFRLGRQTEWYAGNTIQSFEELLCFEPRDERNRVFGIAGKVQHLSLGHDGAPESVSDFSCRYIIRRKKNKVRRLVGIRIRVVLVGCRPHNKRTALHTLQVNRHTVHLKSERLQRIGHMGPFLCRQRQQKKQQQSGYDSTTGRHHKARNSL